MIEAIQHGYGRANSLRVGSSAAPYGGGIGRSGLARACRVLGIGRGDTSYDTSYDRAYDILANVATKRAPRNTLTRELLMATACELLSDRGLEAFTVRALADELGVRPMSIYHYTSSKDELLDDLVDKVFSEVYLPDRDGEWLQEIDRRSRSMRETLLRRPWALSLLEARANPGPATLANHEAVLEVLHRAGFTPSATAQAYAMVDAFVYGFVLQEVMLDSVGFTDDPSSAAAAIDMARYPRMLEMAAFYSGDPPHTFSAAFNPGLALVLRGVSEMLKTPDPEVGP